MLMPNLFRHYLGYYLGIIEDTRLSTLPVGTIHTITVFLFLLQRMSLMLTEEIPRRRPAPRRVCITGAVYPSTCYLISELLQLKELHTTGGITIYLHQKNMNKYEGVPSRFLRFSQKLRLWTI